MTTINQLRQRMETRYLEPVVEETAVVGLLDDIDISVTTFRIIPGVLDPDEESYYAPGRILELDSEMVRIVSYNATIKEVTCIRGVRDSDRAPHTAASTEVRIPTRWPRKDINDAIATAIDSLWQPLFVVKEDRTYVDAVGNIGLPLTTVRVLSVDVEERTNHWVPIQTTLMATHPLDKSMASARVAPNPYGDKLCVVRYGVRIVVPDGLDDEIEDLPLEWERIIIVDAAAALMSGVDIDAVTQEFLTQQLRLERFPVRSGGSISQSLIRYVEYLVSKAERDLKGQYPRRITHRRVSIWK